jgi:hypothetical protein
MIGHFRFFASLSLRELPDGLFMVTFGTTDRADRAKAKSLTDLAVMPAGIAQGMMGVRWESRIPQKDAENLSQEVEPENTEEGPGKRFEGFTSSGLERVRSVYVEFGSDYGLFRFGPYLRLSDIDGGMLALFLNRSLADKVKAIHIYGNEYKLGEYGTGAFRVDTGSKFRPDLLFTPEELSDEWVRIMSDLGPFRFRFSEMTPVRLFEPVETRNSLAKPGARFRHRS